MNNRSLTAFVFARGGSKGVRDKNVRPVADKPLLARAIECALGCDAIRRVVVSTDSEKIADVARANGAEVLVRPSELATDTSPEILTWRHAIEVYREELIEGGAPFISIPATSPLRIPRDVEAALARFEHGDCDIVMGVSPSARNPHLNMVVVDTCGLLKVAIPGSAAARRQDVPEVFDVTTCVYVASARFVLSCSRLMDGRVGHVLIPPERALDVDTEYDLYLADLILRNPYVET